MNCILSIGVIVYVLFGVCHGVTVDCSGSTPLTATYDNTNAVPIRKSHGISICKATLYAHNKVRELHQDTGPLTYNDTLAKQSEARAIYLATISLNGHNGLAVVGENVHIEGSTYTRRLMPVPEATFEWYNRVVACEYNYNTATGNCPTIGFTQVVWIGSTQVGCGLAKISSGTELIKVVVCQYLPAGNVDDLFTSNVKPLKPEAVGKQPKSAADLIAKV